MSVISRWPVLEHHAVTSHDVTPDGIIADEALEAWLMHAREAYIAQNHELHAVLNAGAHLEPSLTAPAGACERLGPASKVAVSAGVAEVHPDSFTLSLRVRPAPSDADVSVNVRTQLRIVDGAGTTVPISTELRDAMIALEHDARHYN
jgi:acyl-CoA thioesterase FadM